MDLIMKIIKISTLRKESMPMSPLPDGYEITQDSYGDSSVIFTLTNGKNVLGKVMIATELENVWFVGSAQATKGYGPLLYDAALRYVTDIDGYLTSHADATKKGYSYTSDTSPQAQHIWDYYRQHRPDVIEHEKGFRFR